MPAGATTKLTLEGLNPEKSSQEFTRMNMNRSLTFAVRSAVTFALLALPGATYLCAQGSMNVASLEQPASLFAETYSPALPSLKLTDDGVGYSSSTGAAELDAAENYSFRSTGSEQPPPRRRYGRPNYSDQGHNPDGSNKYAFLAGAGLTLPIGNTHAYLTPSYGFQVGGGRNFNKNLALLLQFDYDHFGFQGSTLTNQTTIYNYGCGGSCTPVSGLDGSSHIWSFTLDPTYTFHGGGNVDAYVVGGVGFYHKTANFTVPAVGTYCDYYYGCYQYEANQTIDKYSSNAAGANGGIGFTYKMSRFANERFYGEVRYVYVANQNRPGGVTVNNYTSASFTATNLYPANGNRSTYIPVKFGIRF